MRADSSISTGGRVYLRVRLEGRRLARQRWTERKDEDFAGKTKPDTTLRGSYLEESEREKGDGERPRYLQR